MQTLFRLLYQVQQNFVIWDYPLDYLSLGTPKPLLLFFFFLNQNPQYDGDWNGGTEGKVEEMELAPCQYYFAKNFRDAYVSSFSLYS